MLPQIIMTYTISSDTQDSTNTQNPVDFDNNVELGDNKAELASLQGFWDFLFHRDDYEQYVPPNDPVNPFSDSKGACKGHEQDNRIIHVTCEGPEVDSDPPTSSFESVVNCDGGKFGYDHSLKLFYFVKSFQIFCCIYTGPFLINFIMIDLFNM